MSFPSHWGASMPTEDGRLGVLLLSFASVGGQAHQRSMYLPVLSTHPRLRLVAVADEREASAEQHATNRREAAALGLPYVADLADALADPRVDLVSVCCPFERRVDVLRQVAAAGKHALVDKPLALTLEDCDAIQQGFAEATPGLVCMPAYHYRFHPAMRSARAAVAGGTIGLPWAAHGEFVIANGTAAWPLGELLNFGLYATDALRAVLGLEVRSVYATLGSYFYGEGPDDFSVLALTLEHGVIATTSVGRAPTAGHPNGYSGDRRLRVMGSHGTITVDAAAPALSVYGGGAPGQRYYGGESLRGLVDHLVTTISGMTAPELGIRDARKALEVVLAARTAARENRVVYLEEFTE
jgi:predicted dehydrogenase